MEGWLVSESSFCVDCGRGVDRWLTLRGSTIDSQHCALIMNPGWGNQLLTLKGLTIDGQHFVSIIDLGGSMINTEKIDGQRVDPPPGSTINTNCWLSIVDPLSVNRRPPNRTMLPPTISVRSMGLHLVFQKKLSKQTEPKYFFHFFKKSARQISAALLWEILDPPLH